MVQGGPCRPFTLKAIYVFRNRGDIPKGLIGLQICLIAF